jgi:hypothetical protein
MSDKQESDKSMISGYEEYFLSLRANYNKLEYGSSDSSELSSDWEYDENPIPDKLKVNYI